MSHDRQDLKHAVTINQLTEVEMGNLTRSIMRRIIETRRAMIAIPGGVDIRDMGRKKDDNLDLFEVFLIDELNVSI